MSVAKKSSLHEQVANRIIEQLKQGTAPWQKPWGEVVPSRPYNALTGKEYRGMNSINLVSNGFDDPRWMTFNQAKNEGYTVKKGSKGSHIQSIRFHDEQIKRDESGTVVKDSTGQPVKEMVKLDKPIIRTFVVFNAEQINGIAPLEKKLHEWNPVQRAESLLQASQADIEHKSGDRAYYTPMRDKIVLPNREQFTDAEKYYSTALHELGHWTGHESRLDRPLMNAFGTEAYAKEELRAEIASMMLGQTLGIGHDPGQHVAYVGSWIKALQDDPYEIVLACQDAEKVHDYVMAFERTKALEPVENFSVDRHSQVQVIENKDLVLTVASQTADFELEY